MAHPNKWRDTCDPFQLPFSEFQLASVLGYPHAGNDVFHVTGKWRGETVRAYIKAVRRGGAALENEYRILKQLDSPVFPRVLDFGFGENPFLVSRELPGERLSVIVGQNEEMVSLSYMEEYGRTLAKLHSLDISVPPVADRRFFHKPQRSMLEKLNLDFLKYFFDSEPETVVPVFCHGDFHYANILWENHRVSGILDFEFAGIGNRDFDIAWAMIRRPGQKFMKQDSETERFLSGYREHGSYDAAAVQYYMAQIYVYFLSFSKDDTEYCEYVRNWLRKI